MKNFFNLLANIFKKKPKPIEPYPVPVAARPSPKPLRARWTNHEWSAWAFSRFSSSPIMNIVPTDWNEFFVGPVTPEKWIYLLSCMAEQESNFNPQLEYREKFKNGKGETVISTGLLQVSYESVGGFGSPGETTESLKDPFTNITCAVRILERLVARDKRVAGFDGASWLGGARYWAVLRNTKYGSDGKVIFEGVKKIKTLCRAYKE
jgi:hypothetical protein